MTDAAGANLAAFALAAAMALVAVVTQLAASGKIQRNGFLGIRVPPTMATEEGWLAGHKAAVLPSWIGVGLVAAAAVVAQFVPGPGPFVACVILLLLSLTVAVVVAWRAAGSAPS